MGPVSGRGLSWFGVLVSDEELVEAVLGRLVASDSPVTKMEDGFVVHYPDEREVHFRFTHRNSSLVPGGGGTTVMNRFVASTGPL